jgi:hypothetical protein
VTVRHLWLLPLLVACGQAAPVTTPVVNVTRPRPTVAPPIAKHVPQVTLPTWWYGKIGAHEALWTMVRDNDRLRFTGTPALQPQVQREGTIAGSTVRLRGPGGEEWTAEFRPTTVHDELAFLDGPEISLVEDMTGDPQLGMKRHFKTEIAPALRIDIARVEIKGDEFAVLDAWGKDIADGYDALVRDAAAAHLEEVRRVNPAAVNDPDLPGAALASTAYAVLLNERFVSVHEDHSVYTGGAHPQNGALCATLDRSTKKLLTLSDVFSVADVAAAVEPALEGLEGLNPEVSLDRSNIELAVRADAPVCLTRIGVWLFFGLPHALAALDGISIPYARLQRALRPGIAPR